MWLTLVGSGTKTCLDQVFFSPHFFGQCCSFTNGTPQGAETVSHIRENGRVTILFHAFEGPARIVRLYGKGLLRPMSCYCLLI